MPTSKPIPSTATSATTPPANTPPAYDTFRRLKQNKRFHSAADRAIQLRRLVAIGDAAKEELKRIAADELEPELLAGGVKENTTITYEGARLRIMDKGSGSRIDGTKLVQLGVSKKLIAEATVENARQHYIDIKLPVAELNQMLREHGLPEKKVKEGEEE
jgi:hypothetical protein